MRVRTLRHDSPLGSWLQALWSPPSLAGIVDTIWYFDGVLAFPRERTFPDSRVELIVHLGAPYRRVQRDGSAEPFATACIGGIPLRSEIVEGPGQRTRVIGIRMHPAGSFAVLGAPVHELTGLTVDLLDVVDGGAELAERCAAEPTAEGTMLAAARWVEERTRMSPLADPAVAWGAAELERSGGRMPVRALHDRIGMPATRFTARFREQIGVAPKVLGRIVRFRRALELVRGGSMPLATVATTAGYYDQPHFNVEFREFAGVSPREYRAGMAFPTGVNVVAGG